MRPIGKRAFTIIELLIVLAIIAVLAGILFPVFNRVRENARQATCISNMHQIFVAAGLYKVDHNQYPCMLLGPAERADGYLWTEGDPTPVVAASNVKYGSFLYPAYIKSIDVFHCPDNPDNDMKKVTPACYPRTSPWNAWLTSQTGHDFPTIDMGSICRKIGLPPAISPAGQPVQFYAYDSYDISAGLRANGTRINAPGSNPPTPGFFITYCRKWTQVPTGPTDSPNQLIYAATAPPDKTVLALCNYHVTTAKADKCPVIFASGTAKSIDYVRMVNNGWNVANVP